MELIGKTLGQYRIVERIGQGGMATVYKAYQANLDRFVALKVLPPQHAQTPGYRERFFREAKAVARLSHPNILPIFDIGIEADLSYIAMKYVPDRSLRDIMGEPMRLETVCRYLDQIAGALDHAHGSGIIHRDIKPGNLLLEGDRVFLVDFGIAKILEESVALTFTGEIMGTPFYISPEQASGKPVDQRTDIYSLGIVVYQMVTGEVPYKGETPYGVIFRHINDPLPLPREHRPDLPESVERVILKALAKNPDDRYQKAGLMAEALREAVQGTMRQDRGIAPEPFSGAAETLTSLGGDKTASFHRRPPAPRPPKCLNLRATFSTFRKSAELSTSLPKRDGKVMGRRVRMCPRTKESPRRRPALRWKSRRP